MKKHLSSILILTIFSLPVFSQAKDDIIGKWFSSSGGAQIQIYKKADKFFGKIVWLKNPNDEKGNPKTDIRNPNPELRSRLAVGMEILKNFDYLGEGVWDNGTIYDPKSGRTYSCKMTLNGKNNLDIRGYVGISMLGRTESWTRAN
jgi:uncharacterized protein (DUF2147 family)